MYRYLGSQGKTPVGIHTQCTPTYGPTDMQTHTNARRTGPNDTCEEIRVSTCVRTCGGACDTHCWKALTAAVVQGSAHLRPCNGHAVGDAEIGPHRHSDLQECKRTSPQDTRASCTLRFQQYQGTPERGSFSLSERADGRRPRGCDGSQGQRWSNPDEAHMWGASTSVQDLGVRNRRAPR